MKTKSFNVTVSLVADVATKQVDYNSLIFSFMSKKTGNECGTAMLSNDGRDFDIDAAPGCGDEIRDFMSGLEFEETLAKALWARLGGSAKTKAKKAASRENGKLGGRPKKSR